MTWLSTLVVTLTLCILIWGLRQGFEVMIFLVGVSLLATTVYLAVTAVF